jgi:PAS domain S-box-containing protein
MSMLSVALLYFLISTSWASYPFWVATAATGSAILMAGTLVKTSQIAHENFHRLGEATGEAKAMRSKLEFAIESVGDGYFEIDLQTMTYTPNPKFASSLGFQPGAHDVRNMDDFVHLDDIGTVRASLAQCRKGLAEGWDQDLRIKATSGQYRWMTLRARVLATGGDQRLLIGTMVDITSRKQLEAEMLATKEAAIASAKAKG